MRARAVRSSPPHWCPEWNLARHECRAAPDVEPAARVTVLHQCVLHQRVPHRSVLDWCNYKEVEMVSNYQGRWRGGMPYLSVGFGPPLLFMPGLTVHHNPPVGMERRFQAGQITPFAGFRRVWWVNRRPSLAPNASMEKIADDYAAALRDRFTGPVDVLGMSTGGSIALQLAADHPELVKKLVVVCSAYRLGVSGRRSQIRITSEMQSGHRRRASAAFLRAAGASTVSRWVLSGAGWVLAPTMFAQAGEDLTVMIRAEDHFNLRERLGEITAPTLVIGGERDPYYSVTLFRETAELIPNGRLRLYAGRGHVGTTFDPRFVPDVRSFLGGSEH